MTNSTFTQKLSRLLGSICTFFKPNLKRRKCSAASQIKNLPLLSIDNQWKRIEHFIKISQEMTLDLHQKQQTAKEHLNSIGYTLEKLNEELAQLVIPTKEKSPAYRRIKVQSKKSASEGLKIKSSKAA